MKGQAELLSFDIFPWYGEDGSQLHLQSDLLLEDMMSLIFLSTNFL